MFLYLARSPLLVVQEKLKALPLPVVKEKLNTFNVGQAFGASIWLGIWGIHVAGNQIARVAMFLHFAIQQGASRLQELPCFYVMQGHLYQ